MNHTMLNKKRKGGVLSSEDSSRSRGSSIQRENILNRNNFNSLNRNKMYVFKTLTLKIHLTIKMYFYLINS